MSVSTTDLQRAVTAAKLRESQGYFVRAEAGDQRAASLFVRLVADDLNPSGKTTDYGWLSKQPGESQVDGYAEDAIVFGADPADIQNVVDLINGAGAPGASIGGAVKERRPTNLWVAPKPLTVGELNYLLEGGVPGPVPPPVPPPAPVQPYPSESPDGGWWGQVFDVEVATRYQAAGRVYPDPADPRSLRWCGRVAYDIRDGLTKEASLEKHMKELDQALRLP
jgi:hypothetical protein